ncbi:MAG: hypothetical protein KatS3mg081_2161 [Gemmatimonadales bacterium]|nr:MAG: hypothetical protein KatS3mg081_2161 [Gemmatimonadales bacterium]
MVQPVSDVGSNAEENIAHAAKVLGRSTHRRSIFEAIYTGKRRAKKVSDLMRVTGLPRRRVLDAGKRLADNRLVKTTKLDGETAYEKIDFFQSNKRRILSLASSPARLAAFPTKRNPRPAAAFTIRMSGQRARIEQVTVDDIESFRRVRSVKKPLPELGNEYSEEDFKLGMQRILGEPGRFKDWGGEVADLFTTKCWFRHRRRPLALALKGPGTKGKLTPGKMGKNGDQIQRLFEAPAEVFLIQYCRQIDSSVLTQMQQLAVAKSLMTGTRVYYGVIDGSDSRRLVTAYRDKFNSTRSGRRKKRRA